MAGRLLVADSPADVPILAVACRRVRAPDQRVITHAAIFYRDADEGVHTLHLRGRNDLRRETCSPAFGWVIPRFGDVELTLLADLCELIYERYKDNAEVPYGLEFSYDARFQHATGELDVGGKLAGLTCATFVLAVFNSFNFHLLDLDTWEYRPEDRDWQEWIGGYDLQVVKEIPCLRYRPEEVTGACLEATEDKSIPFVRAVELATSVLTDLDAYLGRSGLAP